MPINDIPTFNAAFTVGFASFQSTLNDTNALDYLRLVNAAVAFATQVDTAVQAAGGAGVKANRANLMQSICIATIGGRALISLQPPAEDQPATYTNIAAAIAAAYVEAQNALLGTDAGTSGSTLLIFPNYAALQAFNVTSPVLLIDPGQQAFVQSNGSTWTLRLDGTIASDGKTILTAAPGEPLKWVRENISGYLPKALKQGTWFIDPAGTNVTPGNDEAAGTALAPLATFAEFIRRVGYTTRPVYPDGSGVTVNFISSQGPNVDPIVFEPVLSGGAQAVLIGVPQPVASVAAGAITAKNKNTGTPLQVAGMPGGAAAGQLVFNSTRNSYAFIDSLALGVATMQQPQAAAALTTPAVAPAPVEDNGWTAGDNLQLNTLLSVNLVRWSPVATDTGCAGWTQWLELADSGAGSSFSLLTQCPTNALSLCKLDARSNVSSLNGRGQQSYLLGCTCARLVQFLPSASSIFGGGFAAGISYTSGGHTINNDATVHSVLAVTSGAQVTFGAVFVINTMQVQSFGSIFLGAAGCVWGAGTCNLLGAQVLNNSGTTWVLAWLATGAMAMGGVFTGSTYSGGGVMVDGVAINPTNIDGGGAGGAGIFNPRTGDRYANAA
jgi:hypothetical protein